MYVFYVLKAKPFQTETLKEKVSIEELHIYLLIDTYMCVCLCVIFTVLYLVEFSEQIWYC